MAKTIFNVFFDVIYSIIDLILTPVNQLITNYFPNVNILISNFNSFINTYFGNGLAFFGSLIPPITKSIILFYLGYLVARMVVILNVHLILMIFKAIKNVKIW